MTDHPLTKHYNRLQAGSTEFPDDFDGVVRARQRAIDEGRLCVVAYTCAGVRSGLAAPDVVAARRASCDACPQKVVDSSGEFCGACRCPHTPLAELSRKLRFAKLRCPLRRPGFSNAEQSAVQLPAQRQAAPKVQGPTMRGTGRRAGT